MPASVQPFRGAGVVVGTSGLASHRLASSMTGLRSASSNRPTLPWIGDSRLHDTVYRWLHTAHDARLSRGTGLRGSAWAHLFPGCGFVVSGTTSTGPSSVLA